MLVALNLRDFFGSDHKNFEKFTVATEMFGPYLNYLGYTQFCIDNTLIDLFS
jgi:hypothetical protein